MYYVLMNKYKLPTPYWTWADAQLATCMSWFNVE